MAHAPLPIEYDALADVVTICGMRYSGALFRGMALVEPGTWLRIEGRNNGVLQVYQADDRTGRTFDAIAGRGVASMPDR